MAFKVTLQPSGHSFDARDDETLLTSGLDSGIHLPYGCKNGACGACKARVVEGDIDHGAAMDHALSPEDRAAGKLLLCCAKPKSDLVLECREAEGGDVMPLKMLPCRVQKMEKLAPDVMLLGLRLPSSERLQFMAGQYIDFLLADGQRRAFSIANAPHDDELLQIHVRLVPGGRFTTHVFGGMKERDILRIEGPQGTFYLRELSTKPIIMLAGGTGFAPIKAMVEHAIQHKIARPITIYWGARDRAGLYLPDLPPQWCAAHSHIRYVPVLSEPAAGDNWTGRTGLVHQAVLDDHAGGLGGFQVYACGAPAMIDAARRDFAARGLPEEEFFADSFTFAPQTP
jgi:CDP-4-dehydro-6-deoxyglucose reductase